MRFASSSIGLRCETAAERARARALRGDVAAALAAHGRLPAKASAPAGAEAPQPRIRPAQGPGPAAASDGGDGAEPALGDAMRAIACALRNLTGNLIRIVCGGGLSSEIIGQLLAVAVALERYSALANDLPDESAVAEGLRGVNGSVWSEPSDDPMTRRLRAENDVIRAALQVAASRLMAQPAIEELGLGELYQGIQSVLSLLPR